MLSAAALLLLAPLAFARPQEPSASAASTGASEGEIAPITGKATVLGFPRSRNISVDFTFSFQQGVGTAVTVLVNSGLTNTSAHYPYHLHTNPVASDGNCSSTLGHLDPLVVTDFLACDSSKPELCQEGDLSGKFGRLNGSESGGSPQISFTDPRLRAYPQDLTWLGRSVTIHFPNGTRIACGNITSTFDGTEDEQGNPTNTSSNYVRLYPSKAAVPQPTYTPFAAGATNATALSLVTLPQALIGVPSAEYVNLVTTSVATVIAGSSKTIGQVVAVPSSGSYTGGSAFPSAAQITASIPTPAGSSGAAAGPSGSAGAGTGAASSVKVAAWTLAMISVGAAVTLLA